MPDHYSFPSELLTGSKEKRAQHFKKVIANHRLMKSACKEITDAINQGIEGTIVLLYGPAGTGKSTVLREVEAQVIKAALPRLNPGCIPFLRMVAPAPDNGNYDWRDHYTRALLALNEVLIENKIIFADSGKVIKRVNARGVDRSEQRRIYEDALKYREVKVVGIDEAHHLLRISKGRKVYDQMECIKSLGVLTEAIHILAGTYQLLRLRSLSAQVSRRSVNIYFGRYIATIDADLCEFKNVIYTFQRQMPLAEEPDILTILEYLYTYSCGCVGVLKDWMTRAYCLCLEEKHPKLLLKHIEKTAMSLTDLDRLAIEIKEGEEMLNEKENTLTLDEVRKKLGLKVEPNMDGEGSSKKDNNSTPSNRATNNRRVGEPSPTRFPVGT